MKLKREWVNTKKIRSFALLISLSLGISVGFADQIDDTRSTLKQWVAVEKTISEEQNNWKEDKALLNDLLSSLSQEERILRETIANAEQDTSRADQERLELISRRDAYEQSSNLFEGRLVLYERQARQLIPRLPTLLKDEVGLMINKLYLSEGGNYSLSERAQTLISILSAIQDFDSSITVANEIRTLESGDEVEVKVLFLGLSRAFYADVAKRTAGTGHPVPGGSEDGWQWLEQNDLGDNILKAVEIYENRESPALINLPLEIQVN